MVLKYFETQIAPRTIEQRVRRLNATNVAPYATECNHSEIQDNQVEPGYVFRLGL